MARTPSTAYTNVHGRRWGRGLRPYLLAVKLLGVCGLVGGLAFLAFVQAAGEPGDTVEGWPGRVAEAHRAFGRLILPGLALAAAAGIALWASIWRAMIRMRWFRVKMAVLLIGGPGLHLLLRSTLLELSATVAGDGSIDAGRARTLYATLIAGVALALVWAVGLMILGRIKPRLGQDIGRTLAGSRPH